MSAEPDPNLPIYLDHHATTPLDPRVLEAMQPWWSVDFGNPASGNHVYGWRAEAAVEEARERIAAVFGAESREVFFTSGATESNNLAILGVAEAPGSVGRHIVTAETEHPAVLDPCQYLEAQGWTVTRLPVEKDGRLDPDRLRASLREETALVSVMFANNEIGVVQPIETLASICRDHQVPFHTDAAQAAGRVEIDLAGDLIDLLSISGHKIYGPKGIGALFVRRRRPRVSLAPRQFGGGHEGGLRPGTLPVPLIVGLARALEICAEERIQENARLLALKQRLYERIREAIPAVSLNGHADQRLAGNLNLTFEGIDGARLLLALKGLAVSSGSACASAKPEPSHVLRAIGLSEKQARSSLRFGLGRWTTSDEIDQAAEIVIAAANEIRGSRLNSE